MKKAIFLLCLLVVLVFSCNNSSTKNNYTTQSQNNSLKKDTVHLGKKLMKMHCYACHNATTSEASRVAPPMIAIKRRYLFTNTSKEAFIKDMQEWIKNPSEENAKMYGAVKRFGIMSRMYYPEDIIEKIADYMYDNEIEKPEWFDEHSKNNRSKNKPKREGL